MYLHSFLRRVEVRHPYFSHLNSRQSLYFSLYNLGPSLIALSQSAEPIYLHVIRPLIKPYVSTLDAVLNFVHNLGDFVLLILSLPFSAAISWWYGSSTDEDQAGLTEVDSESVRSYGDEQAAPSRNRSEYGSNTRPLASREVSQSGGVSGIPYSRGARENRNSTDTLRSRFYAPPGVPAQQHEIWHPPPSWREDIDGDETDHPASVPSVAMPEPQLPSITVDDWPTYPPFPSAYPPTPVHPSQINMPEPVHPSQFSVVPEEGTGTAVAINDQNNGARPGFGRSLLPPREPLNPGSDGDLSDETKNPGIQIHETRYVTSSDGDEDMDDYETEEDSFDVTFQTPRHLRLLRAVPMGREVSNVSIVTEATVASSAASEMTGLTTDHHASSLRTATVTVSRSASLGSSSAAGVKRPLPNYKIGVRPRIRAAEHRSPRKATPVRGTGNLAALPRLVYLKPKRGGTVSEDTLDDEGLEDADVAQRDDPSQARKRRRVLASPGPKRVVASRPAVRVPRNVTQTSQNRPIQDSRINRVVRPPVVTKTSLRNGIPRVAKGSAAALGSAASPRKAHQVAKRKAIAPSRP